MTRTTPKPTDQAFPGLSPDDCVVGSMDDGILGSVSTRPRASAQRYFAEELGVRFQDVSCRVRYIRFMDRQEVWEYGGAEQWLDVQYPDGPDEPPDEPPADWEPDGETLPAWMFCKKDHPDAIRVHISEERKR